MIYRLLYVVCSCQFPGTHYHNLLLGKRRCSNHGKGNLSMYRDFVKSSVGCGAVSAQNICRCIALKSEVAVGAVGRASLGAAHAMRLQPLENWVVANACEALALFC